jgi:hypothetical protein
MPLGRRNVAPLIQGSTLKGTGTEIAVRCCQLPAAGSKHSAEIEQELWILSVAMIPAKDDLQLVMPQSFFTPSAERAVRPSRL